MREVISSVFTVGIFLLVILSSCVNHRENNSLLPYGIYINENTSDEIGFIDREKIVFTWNSDIGSPWEKGRKYEFTYVMGRNGSINVIRPTSGEGRYFPYRTLRLSENGTCILFVDRYDTSGQFEKKK